MSVVVPAPVRSDYPRRPFTEWNMPTRECPRCGITFRMNSGRQVYCTYACKRHSSVEVKYKLPHGWWEETYRKQGGVCALCAAPFRGWGRGDRRLMVDHDHETGGVRGLLCGDCNTAIGRFGDDPVRLRAAAEYIERFRRDVAP